MTKAAVGRGLGAVRHALGIPEDGCAASERNRRGNRPDIHFWRDLRSGRGGCRRGGSSRLWFRFLLEDYCGCRRRRCAHLIAARFTNVIEECRRNDFRKKIRRPRSRLAPRADEPLRPSVKRFGAVKTCDLDVALRITRASDDGRSRHLGIDVSARASGRHNDRACTGRKHNAA